MNYSRKDFLKLSSGLAGALALSPLLDSIDADNKAKRIKNFGLQLWTVREDLAKNARSVIYLLSKFGYKYVESFDNGPKGIYWGMSNIDFKKCLDDVGMTINSTHIVVDKEFEKKVAEAAEIGMKYVIFQWEGPGKTLDDYKRYAEDFNIKGEYCKKNGIRFGYHNHFFSFRTIDGQLPQDILMKGTDPALVDFQMDIFYVVGSGHDPEEWLRKYKGRFRLCHIKDRSKDSVGDGKSCVLGEGSIDFPKILKTAKQNGMEYYIAEQEDYDSRSAVETAQADAGYMKNLRF